MGADFGYDLLMFSHDEDGFVEPGLVPIQLKAAEWLQAIGSAYVFDLDSRDYNLRMLEEMPVILILFDASRRRADWLHVQGYFREDALRRPKKGARTVRVHVPMQQSMIGKRIWRMLNYYGFST